MLHRHRRRTLQHLLTMRQRQRLMAWQRLMSLLHPKGLSKRCWKRSTAAPIGNWAKHQHYLTRLPLWSNLWWHLRQWQRRNEVGALANGTAMAPLSLLTDNDTAANDLVYINPAFLSMLLGKQFLGFRVREELRR